MSQVQQALNFPGLWRQGQEIEARDSERKGEGESASDKVMPLWTVLMWKTDVGDDLL